MSLFSGRSKGGVGRFGSLSSSFQLEEQRTHSDEKGPNGVAVLRWWGAIGIAVAGLPSPLAGVAIGGRSVASRTRWPSRDAPARWRRSHEVATTPGVGRGSGMVSDDEELSFARRGSAIRRSSILRHRTDLEQRHGDRAPDDGFGVEVHIHDGIFRLSRVDEWQSDESSVWRRAIRQWLLFRTASRPKRGPSGSSTSAPCSSHSGRCRLSP